MGKTQHARQAKKKDAHLCYVDPNILERTLTAINELCSASLEEFVKIKVEDIIDKVSENAETNQEERPLGPRTVQTIHTSLSRLRTNGYILYQYHRDDIERIALTQNCKVILQDLAMEIARSQYTFATYSPLRKHHSICGFFRMKLQKKLQPALTRQQLDLRNRELEFLYEECLERLRAYPPRQRSPSVASVRSQATEIVPEEDNPRNNMDSMYVDDVPPAVMAAPPSAQIPQTPIRRSSTLNNPEAYPSPESAPRNLSAPPTTPPETPTRSRSRTHTTPGTFDHDPVGDDSEMDVDIPRTPSNVLFGQTPMVSEQGLQTEVEMVPKKQYDELYAKYEAAKQEWCQALSFTKWRLVAKLLRCMKQIESLGAELEAYKELYNKTRKNFLAMMQQMPEVPELPVQSV